MKNALYFSLISFALFTNSCDKVTNPIVPVPVEVVDTSGYVRNILLEDYTGQDCLNCPRAAYKAEELDSIYSKLIVLAVHSGDFAKPYGEFTNDFRTTAGNTWLTTFGIASWPRGMVNRKKYSGSSVSLSDTGWPTSVSLANSEPFILGLEPTVSYNENTRILNVQVKGTFPRAYAETVQVCAVLIEDSIIGLQNVYGVKDHHYEFNHVVRGTIPDANIWGIILKAGPIAAKTETTVTFPAYTVKTNYMADNCSIVIFASDNVTREVLQVVKVKLIK